MHHSSLYWSDLVLMAYLSHPIPNYVYLHCLDTDVAITMGIAMITVLSIARLQINHLFYQNVYWLDDQSIDFDESGY